MSGIATAVGTAVNAVGADKTASAQSQAAHRSMVSQRNAAGLGDQGVLQLKNLMGYDLGGREYNQYGEKLRREQRTNGLSQIKGAGNRLKWIKAETDKYMQSRKQDANFGFLNKRFDNSTFEKDPGYQWRMDEGMKGINNSLAARHNVFSGAALKEAGRYNQGFASNEYGNAYNRYTNDQNNIYNRAMGVTGMGQQAIGNMNEYRMQGANADASGYIGMGNALSNGISGGLNYYSQQQALKGLAPKTNITPQNSYILKASGN